MGEMFFFLSVLKFMDERLPSFKALVKKDTKLFYIYIS